MLRLVVNGVRSRGQQIPVLLKNRSLSFLLKNKTGPRRDKWPFQIPKLGLRVRWSIPPRVMLNGEMSLISYSGRHERLPIVMLLFLLPRQPGNLSLGTTSYTTLT